MRKTLAAAVLSLVACSPQDLGEMSAPPGVTELSHRVAVRFEQGATLLTVTRELRNDTAQYQQLNHKLALPEGAIATALRIGAAAQMLLSSEEADQRWSELTSPGDAAPSTLGLLHWSSGPELGLFGLAPGEAVHVEYDLEVPLVYEASEWQFEYPLGDLGSSPEFHFPRALAASVEEVRDAPIELGGTVSGYRIHQPRAAIDQAEAHWATYPLGASRTLWRLELDAAPVLEPAPVRPKVVFVIDGSHSEGPEGISAQLEVLPAYLASVPEAQVEVVVYRRFAERLFGHFVPASEVPRRLALEAARLAPGNGSNLELGARAAVDALASGPGRILIFTDEALRDGFENQAAIAELSKAAPGTIVHLVARESGSEQLTESRDDEATLAPIAAAGGGIFLRVAGHTEDPKLAATVLLGLVRPIRIDHFVVEAKGLNADQIDAPSELLEGSTLRATAIAEQVPEQVTLTGKIWARDFRRVVPIDFNLADRMPGFAIGNTEVLDQLSEDETRTAAMASRAVSPYTSYLSAGADAAPSTIGVVAAEYGFGSRGFGCFGCRGGSSTHCGIRGAAGRAPDYNRVLQELLAAGVASCGGAPGASIRIEATGDEVVEVEVGAASSQLASCLTEAAWRIRLTPIFSAHRTYQVDLH